MSLSKSNHGIFLIISSRVAVAETEYQRSAQVELRFRLVIEPSITRMLGRRYVSAECYNLFHAYNIVKILYAVNE